MLRSNDIYDLACSLFLCVSISFWPFRVSKSIKPNPIFNLTHRVLYYLNKILIVNLTKTQKNTNSV